jgi:DNA (cytosine-5)-methyltransferase 1
MDELEKLPLRSLKPCKECSQARAEEMKKHKTIHQSRKPLRGLELFAGAGGLSTGFDQSGFVKTVWAVEMEPSAVLSYQLVA